jgi:hypothetical protein
VLAACAVWQHLFDRESWVREGRVRWSTRVVGNEIAIHSSR